MADPSWCGPGHGFTDEMGISWHSGSSVSGARCWPDTSAKLLGLCSSWGMGPSCEEPHAAALSPTLCIVTCPDVWVTVYVTLWDRSHARAGAPLRAPVDWEGVNKPVWAPRCPVQTTETRLGVQAVQQSVYRVSGRATKCYRKIWVVPWNRWGQLLHCSMVIFSSDLRGRHLQ